MTSINQAIKEKSHKEKQCRKHQDKISRTEEEIATLTRQPHGLNRESKNALQCEITNKDIEKAEMEVCKSAEQLKKSEIAVNEAANAYQEATQEKKNAEEKAFELSDAPSLFTKLMDAVLALLAISKWLWAYVKWKTPKNKLLNARLQLKVKTINQTNTKTTLGVAKTNVLRDTVNLQTAQSILEEMKKTKKLQYLKKYRDIQRENLIICNLELTKINKILTKPQIEVDQAEGSSPRQREILKGEGADAQRGQYQTDSTN